MAENNTPDENFGYQPGNPAGHPGGPGTYDSGELPEVGEGVSLTGADIDELAVKIAVEDPAGIRSAAHAWENLSDQFVESMGALRRAGTTLQSHWESPSASEAFLAQVGRATWSVEDWQSAMGKNAGALHTLATRVQTHKSSMATLYAEYLTALAQARAVDDVEAADPRAKSLGRALRGDRSAVEKAKDDFSRRARSEVATPLDEDYQTAFLKISRGSRWQGPTNAAVPQPPAPPAPGAPAGPGGGAVAPSGPGGARPGAPRGAAPTAPTAAIGAPAGTSLAPAAPRGTPSTTAATPVAPAGRPGAAPRAPGAAPQRPGAVPAAPGTTAGAAPDSAELADLRRQLDAGTAAPVAPGIAPGALTGRGPAPAAPSGALPSGATRSAPAAPGGTPAAFRAPTAGAPGAPGAPLTGRPTGPAAPGAPTGPGAARPGTPGTPGGPGRTLAGRNAPAAPGGRPSGAGGAPTSGLGGRSAAAAPGSRGAAPAPPGAPRADAGFARKAGPTSAGGPAAPGRAGAGRGPAGGAPSGAAARGDLGSGSRSGSSPAGPGGPGRTAQQARGAAAGAAAAGPRGGMPSRLAGRTDPTSAGRPVDPRPSVATRPALVAKDLSGRFGVRPDATPAEITRAVRAALRERLSGRAALAADPGGRQGIRDRGAEIEESAFAVLASYDDEDLFTILQQAPAIIDRIKPPARVKDAGPALGITAP